MGKAGRPPGSTTKPRLSDFLTEKDVKELVSTAKKLAKKGNDTMLKFILEQHFGKAMQTVEADVKTNINVVFDKSFTDAITSKATPDSE